MVNTFLRMNLVKNPRFSSFQILLATVHSCHRLLKMLKLNILSPKSFLGVSLTNSQIIHFIGKESMEVRCSVIFHLLTHMYLMVRSKRYSIMSRKIMIRAGQIAHCCSLVTVMEEEAHNLNTSNGW